MKNKHLTSILIVILFILLCDCNTLTFYEKNLTPIQVVIYSDNSIVFRLVGRLNNTCNVPNLTYRILYPGTNNLVTVYDHQIPFFNFCVSDESLMVDQVLDDQVSFERTITNYIFVVYSKITEEND